MKGNFGVKFTGIYEVELKDSITGEIKQKETFHNIGTVNLEKLLIKHGWSASNNRQIMFYSLRFF